MSERQALLWVEDMWLLSEMRHERSECCHTYEMRAGAKETKRNKAKTMTARRPRDPQASLTISGGCTQCNNIER